MRVLEQTVLRLDVVGSGPEAGDRKSAAGIGRYRADDGSGRVAHRDVGAGDGAAQLIDDGAGDDAAQLLDDGAGAREILRAGGIGGIESAETGQCDDDDPRQATGIREQYSMVNG